MIAQKVPARPTTARLMGSFKVPANTVCVTMLAKPSKLVTIDGIAILRKVFIKRPELGGGFSGLNIAS